MEDKFGPWGHNVSAWAPKSSLWGSFLAKRSRFVVNAVKDGAVVPAGDVLSVPIDGKNNFTLEHTGRRQVDVVIFCTGFSSSQLPGTELPKPSECYRYVFPNEDDTCAYVGFARPVLGSIPSVGELQAMWVSSLWAGICPSIPRKGAQRRIETARLREFWSQRSLAGTLVHQIEYCDGILSDMGLNFLIPNLPPLNMLQGKDGSLSL